MASDTSSGQDVAKRTFIITMVGTGLFIAGVLLMIL